jgi:hypothetical protein
VKPDPVAQLRAKVRDAGWLAPRLKIAAKDFQIRTLRPMYDEQKRILTALNGPKSKILVIKPRQMGASTVILAWIFARLLASREPVQAVSVTHEDRACLRFKMMMSLFASTLPEQLKPNLELDNEYAIGFEHNHAAWRTFMAGGRGQGRSSTNAILHFTEAGFYPEKSSALQSDDESSADAVVASLQSTQHKGPYNKLVMESTGNGPGSKLLMKTAALAQRSQEWELLFFGWFDFPMYSRPLTEGWTPTAEELELQRLHGLTFEQLAWRRYKIEDEGYSLMRFRREYPSTPAEPFLPKEEGAWFDVELVNRVLARTDRRPPTTYGGTLRIYHAPQPGELYVLGGDTSGGTGGDPAVAQVLRCSDLVQVATWSSSTTAPHAQAEAWVQLSRAYGNALMIIEENNYGRGVIEAAERLNANVWKDDKGKNFWTQGGRAGASKKAIYTYARELLDNGHACSSSPLRDPGVHDDFTLGELMIVREGPDGNIEAPPGHHDDHADAYVLALWASRRYHVVAAQTQEDPEVQKLRMARAILGVS